MNQITFIIKNNIYYSLSPPPQIGNLQNIKQDQPLNAYNQGRNKKVEDA